MNPSSCAAFNETAYVENYSKVLPHKKIENLLQAYYMYPRGSDRQAVVYLLLLKLSSCSDEK